MKQLPAMLMAMCLLVTFPKVSAQSLVQVVRGQVLDVESQLPLAFATVTVMTTDLVLGTITDENGFFRLENVSIGRHDLKVSYVGYQDRVVPELMVSTGKEVVLIIRMKELISELKEVVVRANTRKDKPLNLMSTVSARTFSVEETRRYAGGWDDPARLAASFPGVSTENSRDNTIIIRGNSPKGLLWRLEGVEIPNPNHFANMTTFGGGGVSALSALVMGNSDFFTGAFPAEYGNAMSGVFDIRLRAGNNETHEHAVQLGTIGIDLSSEGPLGKNTSASYLFNYRYSTFGLIRHVFPEEIKDFLPVYQDFSFKVQVPTKKAGVFSVWGLAGSDETNYQAEEDSTQWEMEDDRMEGSIRQKMGVAGLNHRYIFKGNAWLNTSLALSGSMMKLEGSIMGEDMVLYENEHVDASQYRITFSSVYNHKFSARHSMRTGFIVNNLHYDVLLQHAPVYDQGMITVSDENDQSWFIQAFSQSKYTISKRFTLNGGLHASYFLLNNEFILEPRLGLQYQMGKDQALSLAYGKHSRLEPLTLYFARVYEGNAYSRPNMDMKVSKAHHLVMAYDISFHPNLRLKIEPYVQFLYDVPVIADSSFSVVNMEADWYFDQDLINTGKGRNLGIDLTLERFLKDGYYYLFTASFFDSRYRGGDGIQRNTLYNSNYVFNALFGKEWILGKQENKILGVNVRLNFFGGRRTTPVDQEASDLVQDVVYDYSSLYEDKEPAKLHVNATINYRINRRRHSSIFSLQFVNLLMAKENYGLYYNYQTQQVERWEFAVPVPNLSYKIEF